MKKTPFDFKKCFYFVNFSNYISLSGCFCADSITLFTLDFTKVSSATLQSKSLLKFSCEGSCSYLSINLSSIFKSVFFVLIISLFVLLFTL